MKTLVQTLWILFVMTILLGLGYPFVITSLSQWLFPASSNGSLIRNFRGQNLGSLLIGQDWSASSLWFQGRPSATGGYPYNPQASGGSNLSPQGKAFHDRVAVERARWETLALAAGQTAEVPWSLLTTSASGLDPELDLEASLWQVPMVAKARKADPQQIRALVCRQIEPRHWPWDSPSLVNVLALNLALDQKFPKP